jgi:hypothetical protein
MVLEIGWDNGEGADGGNRSSFQKQKRKSKREGEVELSFGDRGDL